MCLTAEIKDGAEASRQADGGLAFDRDGKAVDTVIEMVFARMLYLANYEHLSSGMSVATLLECTLVSRTETQKSRLQ